MLGKHGKIISVRTEAKAANIEVPVPARATVSVLQQIHPGNFKPVSLCSSQSLAFQPFAFFFHPSRTMVRNLLTSIFLPEKRHVRVPFKTGILCIGTKERSETKST
jgi:hypothetical protein